MHGLELSSFTDDLQRVSKHARNPVVTIKNVDEKLGPWKRYMIEAVDERFSFAEHYYRLPLRMLQGFSFEELCKMRYSTGIMPDESVDKLFETDPRYEMVYKIVGSMWHWAPCGKGTWNEVVDAYDHIRHFSFVENPDFEIRLDHTTSWNEVGHGKYSRIFIDGVFAFLVYYKQQHVMTIGFSIAENRRLLIQQVQSAKRSGNRYLYRLPPNRMEFVIDLFRKNFPGYRLSVIDGRALIEKTLDYYRKNFALAHEHASREDDEGCRELEAKIAHLEADKPRLVAFYRDTGRFALDPREKKFKGLRHYSVRN